MTIRILQQYDRDCHIPTFGFGAKMPPNYNTSSPCFAINGNIFKSDNYQMKGILKAYNKCLREVRLHGPPAHAPVIKYIVDMIS